jgi:hypothetical protein
MAVVASSYRFSPEIVIYDFFVEIWWDITQHEGRYDILQELPYEANFTENRFRNNYNIMSISCLNGYVFYFRCYSTGRVWVRLVAVATTLCDDDGGRERERGRRKEKPPRLGIVHRVHSEKKFNEFLSLFYDKRWDSWLCVIVDLFFLLNSIHSLFFLSLSLSCSFASKCVLSICHQKTIKIILSMKRRDINFAGDIIKLIKWSKNKIFGLSMENWNDLSGF